MKYTIEIGSGAMICIPSFIETGSGIQKLIRGYRQAHEQHGDLMRLLLFFFQTKESRLMRSPCSVCACMYVCVCPPPSAFERLNQSSRNLVCISCYLSPSQRLTSPLPLTSITNITASQVAMAKL
jgi:hypothetical protein